MSWICGKRNKKNFSKKVKVFHVPTLSQRAHLSPKALSIGNVSPAFKFMTLKSELELNPGHSGSPGEFGFLGIHIKHFFEKKNVCISFDIPIFDKVGPVFHDVF